MPKTKIKSATKPQIRVNREEWLRLLESVVPGLSAKPMIEQSECFVFDQKKVMTFNEEVACTRESLLDIRGAIKAKTLLELLDKLPDDDLKIEFSDNVLTVKGNRRKADLPMEDEILLPIETVEVPEDEDWKELDPEFADGVSLVSECASKDESQFALCCVHVSSEFVEACDRFQIGRYNVNLDLEESVLVRADSLKKIVGLDMTEFCETSGWLHFRNPTGLVFSVRRYVEDYEELGDFLDLSDTTPVTLPGGLKEIVDRSQIFSRDNVGDDDVEVDLRKDRIVIKGESPSGKYQEQVKVNYTGEPLKFSISPALLVEIGKKSNNCGVAEGRLSVDSGKFKYAVSTNVEGGNGEDDGE